MADPVQRLILIAAGLSIASAADFSHKQHLALDLACTQCHSAASSNMLPSPAVCRECHDDGRTVRSTPTPTSVAHFSHAVHLKLGNAAPVIAAAIDKGTYLSKPANLRSQLNTKNQCEACHRGMEETDRITAANFPRMADCLVCHNKIDPPFSCSKCHAETAQLKPATHTPDFIDAHSSGKLALDKTTCAVCHGRRFTCQGCH